MCASEEGDQNAPRGASALETVRTARGTREN